MQISFIVRLKKQILLHRAVFVLAFLGVVLRLRHFLANHSFWVDEIYVALHVNGKNLLQIFLGSIFSSNFPSPPMGFLLIEKLNVLIFGNNEYAFRLFPFICGIASLIIFYQMLKKYVRPKAVFVGFALFVFSESLIYYSAQAKRYSIEVLVTLLLYLFAIHFQSTQMSYKKAFVYGMIGVVAILFSYSSIFILTAIAFVQLLACIKEKDYKRLVRYLYAYALWLICFVFMYLVYVKEVICADLMFKLYGTNDYFSLIFWSKGWILWVGKKIIEIFHGPMGLSPAILAMVFCITGIVYMYKNGREKCLMLLLPVFLVLVASGFKKYPFLGRFLLFVVPLILLFVSEGVVSIYDKLQAKSKIFAWVVILSIFVFPILSAGKMFIKGYGFHEETRPAMQFLKKHFTLGDEVFVNNLGKSGYYYYLAYCGFNASKMPQNFFSDDLYYRNRKPVILLAKRYPFFDKEGHALGERKDMDIVIKTKDAFRKKGIFGRNPRTWFLFLHYKETEAIILDYLNKTGKKILDFQGKGAGVYLYDLSL